MEPKMVTIQLTEQEAAFLVRCLHQLALYQSPSVAGVAERIAVQAAEQTTSKGKDDIND